MVIRENKKPFIITIIVLIVIILGLGGYIAYDYFIKDKGEEKIITQVDNVNINLNVFYQISRTLENLDLAFNKPGTNYYGYIYNSNKLDVKNFDSKAAAYAAVVSELKPSNTQQTIVSDKVKSNFESMFGDILKYNLDDIDVGNNFKIAYDANNKIYSYTMPTDTSNYSNGYVAINYKTYLEDDYVVVTRKIFYVEYNSNNKDASKASIYKNANKQYKLGDVSVKNGTVNLNEVKGKYTSRLNTYDFYFIKNGDEDYVLSKIVKIK